MNEFKKAVVLKKHNFVVPKLFNLIRNMNHTQQARVLEKAEELLSEEKCLRK
jgi:hypothetical protein